ncbi:MAG: ATP-grasp domain-containing protein [Methanosarcina sp.]
MQKILVIGFSTRNIVCSAKRAGYAVYSIDSFQDLDLQKCADSFASLGCSSAEELHQLDPFRIKAQIEAFGVQFDAVVLGSGLETLDRGIFTCPVLASSPASIEKASNKLKLSKKLRAEGIPHPQCYSIQELDAIEYPVIIKPSSGGGGIFNRVARNKQELLNLLDEFAGLDSEFVEKDVVIQAFLKGIPSSVSLLSTKNEAISVAVNEQLIGVPWLSRMPFAYCGNITPFKHEYTTEMETLAEELVLGFGLLGSNGVDFLATESGPIVLEINPRFQGSLDTVEKAMNINLFEAHKGCFKGELPEKPFASGFAARGVIYSDRELFIDRKLMDVILRENSADIPVQGTIVEPDWPLTSLFSYAPTREETVLTLKNRVKKVKAFIENEIKKERSLNSPEKDKTRAC